MTRKAAPETVHVVPRDGLHFDPSDVGPQDVDPETAAALVATGAYVIAAPSGTDAAPAAEENDDDGTR
jgi:hypothetical protein